LQDARRAGMVDGTSFVCRLICIMVQWFQQFIASLSVAYYYSCLCVIQHVARVNVVRWLFNISGLQCLHLYAQHHVYLPVTFIKVIRDMSFPWCACWFNSALLICISMHLHFHWLSCKKFDFEYHKTSNRSHVPNKCPRYKPSPRCRLPHLCFIQVKLFVPLLCVCAILPAKAVPEMTYTVSGRTLNPTHLLTQMQVGMTGVPLYVIHKRQQSSDSFESMVGRGQGNL